jgi:hypothetical protein
VVIALWSCPSWTIVCVLASGNINSLWFVSSAVAFPVSRRSLLPVMSIFEWLIGWWRLASIVITYVEAKIYISPSPPSTNQTPTVAPIVKRNICNIPWYSINLIYLYTTLEIYRVNQNAEMAVWVRHDLQPPTGAPPKKNQTPQLPFNLMFMLLQ